MKVYSVTSVTFSSVPSPHRHMTELCEMVKKENLAEKSLLFIYSDGGPNHRLTYLFVQLSPILLDTVTRVLCG